MDKNKKILKVSLSVIILSAVLSLLLITKFKVDKPAFLMNYCEIETYSNGEIYPISNGTLTLKYIANIDDTRRMTGISFKEVPNSNFFASEYNQWDDFMFSYGNDSNVSEYGRYGIHTVYLSCPNFNFEDGVDEVMLTEATVEFDDGLKMDIDLGEIVLYKPKNSAVALQHTSSQASSDGDSAETFWTKEDMKIEKIESYLSEEALEMFDFNIKYIDIEQNEEIECMKGTTIKKDHNIIISSKYNGNNDILKSYAIYDIRPEIYFVNDYNDEYSIRYYNMRNETPPYSHYGIYKYLKARGEL